jgi:hypothetical protein
MLEFAFKVADVPEHIIVSEAFMLIAAASGVTVTVIDLRLELSQLVVVFFAAA